MQKSMPSVAPAPCSCLPWEYGPTEKQLLFVIPLQDYPFPHGNKMGVPTHPFAAIREATWVHARSRWGARACARGGTGRLAALAPGVPQRPRLPFGVVPQLLLMIWSCFSARSARSSSSSMKCWRRTLALASRAAVSFRNWSICSTSLHGWISGWHPSPSPPVPVKDLHPCPRAGVGGMVKDAHAHPDHSIISLVWVCANPDGS